MEKSTFDKFVKEVSESFSCDEDEFRQIALKYISVSTKSKKSSEKEEDDTLSFIKKNAPSKKTSPVSSSSVVKKCERIPRGKTEICGKNAKNKVDEGGEVKWYCGTEKSGCYSSVLSAQGKKEKETREKKTTLIPPPIPKKNTSEIKSQSLVHKIIQREKITTRGVMVDGKKLFVNPDSRVLFNRDRKAYGELAEDDKTILPISDKNIRWLEATNTPIEIRKEEEEEEDVEEEISISGEEEEEDIEEEEEEEEDIDL